MPSKPSPERDRAKEMYLASGGKKALKEIAKELGMPEKTISCWKYRFKWDDELNGIKRTKKGTPSVHPSRLGNQNAVGNHGGAPPGNKNAFKHGAYEEIKFAHLTERERALVSLMPEDTITQQRYLIAELEIREQRMMERLTALYNKLDIIPHDGQTADGMLLMEEMQTGYTKKSGDDKGKMSTKIRRNALEMAVTIENTITSIQKQKQKALDSLERMLHNIGADGRNERRTTAVEERVQIERERTANDQKRWEYENKSIDEGAASESIAAWNRATRPTEEEIKALFDGEGDEQDHE